MKKKITGLSLFLIFILMSLLVTACNTKSQNNATPSPSLTLKNTQKSARPLAIENEVTTRIKNAVQKISGVQKTTVAIHGVDVIVGVEVKNLTKSKRQMEWDVYNAVKKVEPHYNIYVTADTQLNKRLNQPAQTGMGVKSTGTEVKGIIQDIGKQFVIP